MPRLLRAHPGFFLATTFVLAVSLGVNLLVFTAVNALWLRPLPFFEPSRVVTFPGLPFTSLDTPGLRVFEGGTAAQAAVDEVNSVQRFKALTIPPTESPLDALTVTSGYFRLLRLPVRGRDFTELDDTATSEPTAIISDELWSSAFRRNPEIVGQAVDSRPFRVRIVGIAPAGFRGARRGEDVDLWLSIGAGSRLAEPAGPLTLVVLARLGPTQTLAAAESRFDTLAPNVLRLFRSRLTPVTKVFASSGSLGVVIREQPPFLFASGLAFLLLMGGCATVAALALVHYEKRRVEFAIKVSLGADHRTLLRELARDLVWIAAAGCGAALSISLGGTRILQALSLPGGVDLAQVDLPIDWRVASVAVVATVSTLTIATAVPIRRAALGHRSQLTSHQWATPTRGSLRVRQRLLAVQVCTAVVVLLVAGLFVRTVIRAFTVAPGFDVQRTLFLSVLEAETSRPVGDPELLATMRSERSARLSTIVRGLPGVLEVAEGGAPLGADAIRTTPPFLTFQTQQQERQLIAGRLNGDPELLSALGARIVAGRNLASRDVQQVPIPAVLTRSLAERLWPRLGDALGETFTIRQSRRGPFVVVGVSENLAFGSLSLASSGVVITAGQSGSRESKFVVRAESPDDVARLIPSVLKPAAVRMASGRKLVARDVGRQRLAAWIFSGFGLAGLLLGLGGTFALVAYLAETRRREFGLRLAMGASLSMLIRDAAGAAVVPAVLGVVVGIAFTMILSAAFRASLVGVSRVDPLTYVVVGFGVVLSVVLTAVWGAWRLRATDPSEALRSA